MKLHYQQAVVSLCLDLTNPEGGSRPVAVLLVGRADGAPFAAVAGRFISEDEYDPVTREILRDVPKLVERHLNRAFTAKDVEPEEVLHALQASLRNSLHVSEIQEPRTVALKAATFEKAFPDVSRIVTDALSKLLPAVRDPHGAGGLLGKLKRKRAASSKVAPPRSAVKVWNPPLAAAL